jgi:hypothetical protein
MPVGFRLLGETRGERAKRRCELEEASAEAQPASGERRSLPQAPPAEVASGGGASWATRPSTSVTTRPASVVSAARSWVT